jgi:hypothetical protein
MTSALRHRSPSRGDGREQRHIERFGRHAGTEEAQRIGRAETVHAAGRESPRRAAMERTLRVQPAHARRVVEHAASSPLISGMDTDHATVRFTAADRDQLMTEIGLTDQACSEQRRRHRIECDPKQLDEPRQAAARLSSASGMQPSLAITRENCKPSVLVGGAPCFCGDPLHTCQRHTWRITVSREFARRCTSSRSEWDRSHRSRRSTRERHTLADLRDE